MKTLEELKRVINYQQTDDNFLSYLSILQENQVVTINSGDVECANGICVVSASFYRQVAEVYGVKLDAELNVINLSVGE